MIQKCKCKCKHRCNTCASQCRQVQAHKACSACGCEHGKTLSHSRIPSCCLLWLLCRVKPPQQLPLSYSLCSHQPSCMLQHATPTLAQCIPPLFLPFACMLHCNRVCQLSMVSGLPSQALSYSCCCSIVCNICKVQWCALPGSLDMLYINLICMAFLHSLLFASVHAILPQ